MSPVVLMFHVYQTTCTFFFLQEFVILCFEFEFDESSLVWHVKGSRASVSVRLVIRVGYSKSWTFQWISIWGQNGTDMFYICSTDIDLPPTVFYLMWIKFQKKNVVPFRPTAALVDMLCHHLGQCFSYHLSHWLLFLFATYLLCPVCTLANDTGWPTVGKTNTCLKPPERRDSGTDTQGKSPPSGSPIAPNPEKVSFLSFPFIDALSWVYITDLMTVSLLLFHRC